MECEGMQLEEWAVTTARGNVEEYFYKQDETRSWALRRIDEHVTMLGPVLRGLTHAEVEALFHYSSTAQPAS